MTSHFDLSFSMEFSWYLKFDPIDVKTISIATTQAYMHGGSNLYLYVCMPQQLKWITQFSYCVTLIPKIKDTLMIQRRCERVDLIYIASL